MNLITFGRFCMRKVSTFFAFCGLAAIVAGPVFAQVAPNAPRQKAAPAPKPAAQSEAPAAAAAAPAAADDKATKAIEGFRSAKFGMSESDVRAAMVKDFSVKSDAIKAQDNPAELTQSLLLS